MDIQTELDNNRRRVDVDYYDLPLREIVRMVRENELTIAPDYQRLFRWSKEDESRLIESLFLGLPVPSIFVAANKDGTWEVVDGLQRVSTIVHFAAEDNLGLKVIGKSEALRLAPLDELTKLSNKTFVELPSPVRLTFMKRIVRVTTLSDKSDLDVRFDLFERLNTGGIALTAQEVRSCVYRNDFMKLVEQLAITIDFLALIKLPAGKKSDGTADEMVLKTFAYKYNRENFDGKVKQFLNTFAEEVGPQLSTSELHTLFRRTINQLRACITGPLLRARVSTTPLNLLEAVLVAAYELVTEGVKKFQPTNNWLDDAELISFTTKGTNTRRMLNGRIDRAKSLLQGSEIKTVL